VGGRRAAWRLAHEASARSGLAQMLEPIAHDPAPLAPIPHALDHDAWIAGLGEHHWLRLTHERATSGATQGRIIAHGGLPLDFGRPLRWRAAPGHEHGAEWPAVHWTQVFGHTESLGDIKDVWAIGRALHCMDWVRQRARDGDATRWSGALALALRSFQEQNPWRAGPHWASGQECAIRIMQWCVAVAALGGDKNFSSRDFQRFLALAELHARHLDAHLDFARLAVPNNHLIIEATALAALGHLFPWMKEAERYRTRGVAVLTDEALAQFLPDGGYVQASHNYHRLALEYLLLAARMIPAQALSPHRVRGIFARAARNLARFIRPDGRLPNWGANDGARMMPWSETDHRDYRPLLASLWWEVEGSHPFGAGLWDEQLFWLAGAGACREEGEASPALLATCSDAQQAADGLTHLTRGDWLVTLRTSPPTGLASQCDLFHVDIWHGSFNIAQDAGSYRYHPQRWHDWFAGPHHHNTFCVLDERGEAAWPFERPRRFAFHADASCARVIEVTSAGVLAEHDAWRERGVEVCRRSIATPRDEDHVEVLDHLTLSRAVAIAWSWLLPDLDWQVSRDDGAGAVILTATDSPVSILIEARGEEMRRGEGDVPLSSPHLLAAVALSRGWVSSAYGVK
ncbi:unnamed protein product, partial [Laminaria digitata]